MLNLPQQHAEYAGSLFICLRLLRQVFYGQEPHYAPLNRRFAGDSYFNKLNLPEVKPRARDSEIALQIYAVSLIC